MKKVGLKLNIQKTFKIIVSGPIISWQINGETMQTIRDFMFGGSKITADGDCSHEIKRHLLLGRKVMTNLLLLLSGFSHVRLCDTPQTAAHQAPLSTRFSRQEYWSGLPFPSPMHTCMLSRFHHVQLCATPWTAAHQAPLSTGSSRQEYWWVAISFSLSMLSVPNSPQTH